MDQPSLPFENEEAGRKRSTKSPAGAQFSGSAKSSGAQESPADPKSHESPRSYESPPSYENGDKRDAGPAARRIFLGWEQPPLGTAADWILGELGSDLGDVVVALPGSRAARRLRELLARRAPSDWTPPRIVTQGELSDVLVRLERPVASRLVRTLAWDEALAGLSAAELAQLLGTAPGTTRTTDRRQRLRLAETVRTIHGELAPEGRDFASLAQGSLLPDLEQELARWRVLERAQLHYRELLESLELSDPHEGRLAAIEAGAVEPDQRVVLVGVADMNHLLARLLASILARVSVLVVAPEAEAEAFDGLGRLRSEVWSKRDVPLPIEGWKVAEKPVDQADVVNEVLANFDAHYAASEIVIGVADEEVVPYLQRRLAAAGARAMDAAGTPIGRTPPVRLLRSLARYLERAGFPELAALARDPDLGPTLLPGDDPAARLDAYHVEHLPRAGRGELVDDEVRTPAVQRLLERLEHGIGSLAEAQPRPLAEWARPIRQLLLATYRRSLDLEVESERLLSESLRTLGAALGELEEVPQALAGGHIEASGALELLLRLITNERVPPARSTPGETVVELCGWLDLALDDAPALIVTGFNEGRIPASVGGHAFLPDGMRKRLGLPSDEDRLARDVYMASVILATRAEAVFVTGRRNAVGDPLVPSRLAFQAPEEQVVERVKNFLPSGEELQPGARLEGAEHDHACPSVEGWKIPERMSVSSFRTFLNSPYLFFLERVLGIRSIDDRARELDPLRFGDLAHKVLECLAEEDVRELTHSAQIEAALRARVDELVRTRFGAHPLPAVHLQAEQLKYRLGLHAQREAERRAQGWRIHAAEWTPPEATSLLEVDGSPMPISARIDRIDSHPDGRWAVLDYKTGEKTKDPEKAHRLRNGSWIDLQLPLYRHLTRDLGFEGEPELGYVKLGKEASEMGFAVADWNSAELEQALEAARDVVREVRAGKFEERGFTPYGEIFHAIWGQGMVAVAGAAGAQMIEGEVEA